MMTKILKPLLPVVAICMLMSSCGFLGFNGLSNLIGSNSMATGETESNDESLSSAETSLFNDGPVELPVNIAKNDGVNPALVDVTIVGLGAELNRTDTRFVSSSSCTTSTVFAISGQAGAVYDPVADPIVYVRNTTRDTYETVAANADGSFDTVLICAELDDDITVSTLDAELDDENVSSSPFVRLLPESTGVTAYLFTNTALLNIAQSISFDALGGIYISTVNNDATINMARIHQNGTEPEVILSSSTDLPVYLVATSDGKLLGLDQNGEAQRVEPQSAIADVRGSSVLGSAVTWADVGSDADVEDVLFSGDFTFANFVDFHPKYSISHNASEGTKGLVKPMNGFDGSPIGNKVGFLKADDTRFTIDATNDGSEYYGDYGDVGGFFMVQINRPAASGMLKKVDEPNFELTGDIGASSGNVTNVPLQVDRIDAAEDGSTVVMIDHVNAEGNGLLNNVLMWTLGTGLVQINDINTDTVLYSQAKVSDNGEYVLLCGRPTDDLDSHNLYIYRPGMDDLGTITLLAGERDENYCYNNLQNSMAIDHDGNVIFYYMDMENENAQLGIIFADKTELISDAL